ncbi:RNA-binding S4 domain-containing protein [Vibrio panuliri]|uniref:Urease n=1 Tax=Vibrio panuliri TaxID=1381081 RepID=A0ABX3FES7_9VIBR|nr:RNA-binding S4 domain-containing protein [Vibrio panuliri]KAB1457584.1 RNA-binding S4 domain-containing protein [Vibrio panuliri]OLQ91217.1 urease [Vibrio panuliri]
MSDYNQSQEWDDQGEEIEIEAIGIDVSSQPIELYKVFKIANLVGGGGEAKHLIAEGYVAVNGELETRKRRKMYDGDFFEFNQEYYVVVCDAPVTESEVVERQPEPKPAKKAQQKPAAKKNKSTSKANKSAKSKKAAKGADSVADKQPKKKNENGRGSIDFF